MTHGTTVFQTSELFSVFAAAMLQIDRITSEFVLQSEHYKNSIICICQISVEYHWIKIVKNSEEKIFNYTLYWRKNLGTILYT